MPYLVKESRLDAPQYWRVAVLQVPLGVVRVPMISLRARHVDAIVYDSGPVHHTPGMEDCAHLKARRVAIELTRTLNNAVASGALAYSTQIAIKPPDDQPLAVQAAWSEGWDLARRYPNALGKIGRYLNLDKGGK